MTTKRKNTDTTTVPRKMYDEAIQEGEEHLIDATRTREAAYQLYGAVEELIKLGRDVVVQYTLPSRTDPAAQAFMAGLKRAEATLAGAERVQLQAMVERLSRQLVVQEDRTRQLAEIGQALVSRLSKAKLSRDGQGIELEDLTEYVNLALAIREIR